MMTRNCGKPIPLRERAPAVPTRRTGTSGAPVTRRHARGASVPRTVAADGALREDCDCLSCIERLPHPCESEVVAAATLYPNRAETVEHPREQFGPPEFRLREETQFPRDRGP